MSLRFRSALFAIVQLSTTICLLSSPISGGERIASAITGTSRVYPQALLPIACSNTSAPVYLEMVAPSTFSQTHPCTPLMPIVLGQADGSSSGTLGKNLKFVMLDRDAISLNVTFNTGKTDRAKEALLLERAINKIFIVDEAASPLLSYRSGMNLKLQIFKDSEAKNPLTKTFGLYEFDAYGKALKDKPVSLNFNGPVAEICLTDLGNNLRAALNATLFKSDNLQKLYLKAQVEAPSIDLGVNEPIKTYFPLKDLPSNRTIDVQNLVTLSIVPTSDKKTAEPPEKAD